jgi:capsid protein
MRKIFGAIFDLIGNETPENQIEQKQSTFDRNSNQFYGSGSVMTSPWYPVTTQSFDGEKTPGELGPPIDLIPEHRGLRYRAYEAQLKSDIVKIITGKFFKWVVGNGLKLQVEPNEVVLKMEGVEDDLKEFRRTVEARFKVFSESKMSDYSRMQNLHKRASEAFQTAFLSGDALVLLRVEDGNVNIQVIDGSEVQSPSIESEHYLRAKELGHKIKHGIEINKRGEHVAFFVRKDNDNFILETERVLAKGEETGRLMAWMIYGSKHRQNHHRGIPAISAILEKVEKLDRYTEASVGGAEERAKIAFSIEHNSTSTGENPLIEQMKRNMNGTGESIDTFSQGETIGKNITKTTGKQAFNMPIGAKLNSLDSKQEDNYGPFFDAVFVQVCAAVDVPPEVALQKYSSNYSASRAAINGWGYIVDIHRKDFAFDFYKNYYKLWLEVEILKGKIKSPGFLKASLENDSFIIEAFCGSKFTGINMPHIDPLKEVKAIREMLGDQTKGQMPLINHDRASEQLNQGEWSDNFLKWKEEMVGNEEIIKTDEPTEEKSN